MALLRAAIKKAAADLDKKLIEVEDNLIQRRLTGQGQDTVRWPPRLLSKINYLANGIGSWRFFADESTPRSEGNA